jgi:hypothetical protein
MAHIRFGFRDVSRWLCRLTGLGPLVFSLSACGPPATFPATECIVGSEKFTIEGDAQTGAAGAPLGSRLRLKFNCTDTANSAPNTYSLPEQRAQWAVAPGNGTINGKSGLATTTNSVGYSDVLWALGPTPGPQTLAVTANGQTFRFSAKAVAPTAGGTCAGGGGTDFQFDRLVEGDEVWTLAGSPYRATNVTVSGPATLTIEPAVVVCNARLSVQKGARLFAEGQAGKEITFKVSDKATRSTSLSLSGGLGSPAGLGSVLRFVVFEDMAGLSSSDDPIRIADSRFGASASSKAQGASPGIRFSNSGLTPGLVASSVKRSVFDGFGGTGTLPSCDAAVLFEAVTVPTNGASTFEARVINAARDGLRVNSVNGAPPWALQNCDVGQSGGAGIAFSGDGNNPGATVTGCTLAGNKGPGINNKRGSTYSVNARGNWWGDAAGPGGPAGGGLSAGVDSAGALPAAPAFGY